MPPAQSARIKDPVNPFAAREDPSRSQPVPIRNPDNFADTLRPQLRSNPRSLFKISRRHDLRRDRRLACQARAKADRFIFGRRGQKVRIRPLNLSQIFRGSHHLPQTLIIELVRSRPRRPSTKRRPHRYHMIRFRHILMNDVVREPCERKPPAREKYFHLVRARKLPDAVKDITGLFLGQHANSSSSLSLCDSSSSIPLESAAHLNPPKSCRRGSMPRSHPLLRLSLAAIRRAPQRPLVARAKRVQRIPELRRNPRVRRILHHPHALSTFDLPPNLAPELKVVALVVDGPRAIRLHQNPVIRRCNQLLQIQRLLPRQQADVRHADHRQPVPSFRPHRPARPVLPDRMRSLARTQITGEQPISDDRRALRLITFILV